MSEIFAVFSWWMTLQDRLGEITTFSGLKVSPLDPAPGTILIEDIAHALANQCRFGGHCREFYSVAQHSVHVSECCDPTDAPWGLLHDAAEAYLVDLPRPIRSLPEMAVYLAAERALQRHIATSFGLGPDQPASVTEADDLMLLVEYRDLMPAAVMDEPLLSPPPAELGVSIIVPWTPCEAERRFLKRFQELSRDQTLRLHGFDA